MAVSFVAAGAGDATTASSLSVPYPSGIAAGDILVVHIGWHSASGNRGDYTLPGGGWAQVTAREGADQQNEHALFWIVATGSETGSLSITVDTPGTQSGAYARMYAFRGVNTSSPFTAGNVNSSTGATSVSQPSATTPSSLGGRVVVFTFIGDDCTTTSPSSFTGESNGDLTEAVSAYTTNTGLDAALQLQIDSADRVSTTVSGGSFTYGPSAAYVARSFSLNVAATVHQVAAVIDTTTSITAARTAGRVAAASTTTSAVAARTAGRVAAMATTTAATAVPSLVAPAGTIVGGNGTEEFRKPQRWAWSPTRLGVSAAAIAKKLVAAFPMWEGYGPVTYYSGGGAAGRLTTAPTNFVLPSWESRARGLSIRSDAAGEGLSSDAIKPGHPLYVQSPFSFWFLGRRIATTTSSSTIFGLMYEYNADVTPYVVLMAYANTDGSVSVHTSDGGSEVWTGGGTPSIDAEVAVYVKRTIDSTGLDMWFDGSSVITPQSLSGQPSYSSNGGALVAGMIGGGSTNFSGWEVDVAYLFRDALSPMEEELLRRDPFLLLRPARRVKSVAASSTHQVSAAIDTTTAITAARTAGRVSASSTTTAATAARTAGRVASITTATSISAVPALTRAASASITTATALDAARTAGRVAAASTATQLDAARTAGRVAAIDTATALTGARQAGVSAQASTTTQLDAARTAGRVAAIDTATSLTATVGAIHYVAATIDTTTALTAARTAGRVAAASTTTALDALRTAGRVAEITTTTSLTAQLGSVHYVEAAISTASSLTAVRTAGRVAAAASVTSLEGARTAGRVAAAASATSLEGARTAGRIAAADTGAALEAARTAGRVAAASTTTTATGLRTAGRVASISTSTGFDVTQGPSAEMTTATGITAARTAGRVASATTATGMSAAPTAMRVAEIVTITEIEAVRRAGRVASMDTLTALFAAISSPSVHEVEASANTTTQLTVSKPYLLAERYLREFDAGTLRAHAASLPSDTTEVQNHDDRAEGRPTGEAALPVTSKVGFP